MAPDQVSQILRTKLHRPPVKPTLSCRHRLHQLLDRALDIPLVLLSAPAGYGKSTLASHWLESREEANAWLSLDSADGDISTFLRYFLAALETAVPGACSETAALAQAPSAVPVAEIATTLSNDLEGLGAPLIIVLDDYQHLPAVSEVHELLDLLLRHPPLNLHLIVATRRDPPLELVSLRGRGDVVEIRLEDLRFSQAETADFVEKSIGAAVSEDAIANLQSQLEGWAVGLWLAALVGKRSDSAERFFSELEGGAQATQEYLVQEVISRQSPGIRDSLLRTSIVDRFCAGLCDALCRHDDDANSTAFDGRDFLRSLQDENLFCIPLDPSEEWYRFHHLFQLLLKDELHRVLGAEEIANLHMRASGWFEENALIEEAIQHALLAGDEGRAADLVEAHSVSLLDSDQVFVLEKCLSMLPRAVAEERPGLLMARAWVAFFRFDYESFPALVEKAAKLLESEPDEILSGEMDFFLGYAALFEGDADRSVELLTRASQKIPRSYHEFTGEMEVNLSLARQMQGEEESARRNLESLLSDLDSIHPIRQTRIVAGLAFMHLISANLSQAETMARLLGRIAKAGSYAYAEAWSYYLLGIVHFARHDLEQAERHLGKAVKRRYQLHSRAVVDAFIGLALIQENLGHGDQADETREEMFEYCRTRARTDMLPVAESGAHRLSLRRHGRASALPGDVSPPVEAMLFWLELPALTECRLLLSEGTAPSLEAVERALHQRLDFNREQHNVFQEVAILPLLASAQLGLGRKQEARETLLHAVTLAAPSLLTSPFIESGEPIIELLRQLSPSSFDQSFIRRVLEALETRTSDSPTDESVEQFRAEKTGPAHASVRSVDPDALTNRELDIVILLGQRLQNKEIASELGISAHTVNDHLKNIYQKLQASNRRNAVAEAKARGLLGD